MNSDEPTDLYLAAAFRESNKESTSLYSITQNMFPNEVDEDDGFSKIINDQRVKDSLALYPKRNITFTSSEKDLVLCLFDVIK